MALAAVALVSTSAWAIWNPDADADLLFNMNFETYNNAAHTTTDAKAGIVGTVNDYNTTYPNVFGETGKAGLGLDANFAEMHDKAPGAGVESDVPSPNDCKLTVPSDFRPSSTLAEVADKHTWTFWFNVPDIEGTIIRHASIHLDDEDYKNLVWEIRIMAASSSFITRTTACVWRQHRH